MATTVDNGDCMPVYDCVNRGSLLGFVCCRLAHRDAVCSLLQCAFGGGKPCPTGQKHQRHTPGWRATRLA